MPKIQVVTVFLWAEVRFIMSLPEGLTLRIHLTSEKEHYK